MFIKSLRIFKFGTSLGGVESLIDHFASTMRYFYSKEEREALGYFDNMFRVSVGIENIEDLLADLTQALE